MNLSWWRFFICFLVSFWLAFTKHEFSPIQKKNKGELTSLLVRCFYFLGKIK